MFLDFMSGCTEQHFGYPIRFNLAKEHYTIKWDNPETLHEIEYEDFDYNIIKPNISPFADNLVNEVWPLLRQMWRMRGGFRIEIKFNPEIDQKEFGTQFGPGMYNGVYKFRINDDGLWNATFQYDFEQIENPDDIIHNRNPDRRGAFFAQDYSRMKSNPALRARRLAKPTWDKVEGRSDSDFGELLEEEEMLNKTIDFTFKHTYINSGKWERDSHIRKVSDTSKTDILSEEVSTPDDIDVIPVKNVG